MTLSVSVRAELKRRVSAWLERAKPFLAALAVLLVVGGIPGARPSPFVLPTRSAPELPPDASGRDARVVAMLRSESGKPIANGRVQAFAIFDGAAYGAGAATSDASGRAIVDGLPHGEHWLVADADGYARASSHVILSVGERDLDFVLGPEHALDVAVKDERGAVVANAEVEVTGAEPLPVGARAGGDGTVVVGRLGKGPFLVTARAPGYEEVTQRGVKEGDHVAFILRRLGAIVVRVVDVGGQPVAGAEVAIAGATLWPARIADTDKSGALRVGSLSAGSYALRATRGGDVSPTELGVMLARGEEKTITLTIAPGRFVAVRVMDGDGDDAAPIAGARLSLVEGGLSPFPFEAKSGHDGRARLGPIAPGSATLAARADGFVPRGAIPVDQVGGKELVVSLVRAGVLSGRVVDTRGFPVDGATIEVVGTDFYGAPISDDPRRTGFREAHFEAMLSGPTQLVPAGELGVVPGPVPPIPHAFSGASSLGVARSSDDFAEPWVSRDDGAFRCAPVSPGRIRAFVHHPQYVETMSDAVSLGSGAEAHVDVVMHAGGWLDGRVVDTRGSGVAGARVQIAARHGTFERSTKTATDGTFAFAAVPESVVVSVFQDDEANEPAARETVTIPERETRSVTLTLPDTRPPLPATVRDDRGYPIEGAQLTAHSLDPAAPLRTTVFTDARGEAQIKGAKGVELRVEVTAPGHAPKVVDAAPAVETLALVLGLAETATGEVRSSRRDPIEGAEVVLYTNLGARHARAAADGTFAVKDLASGAATLRVRAGGFAPAARELTIPDTNGQRPFEIPRIELVEGGAVEGVVVDGHGDPVQGARVAQDRAPTYLAVGATPAGVAVTDAEGRFKLPDLPDGELTLEAYAPDVGRARVSGVRVNAGRRTLNLRITVRKEAGESRDPGSSGGVAVTLGETSDPREVVLVGVAQGSEAERAGLAPDDVLLSVDGVTVHTIEEARARLNGPLSDDVVLRVRRADGEQTFRVGREQVRR